MTPKSTDESLLDLENLSLTFISRDFIVNQRSFNLKTLGWSLEINNSKSDFGTCILNNRTITLSWYYLKGATNEVIVDTILHEIAHAIDFEIRGKSDHGLKWKSIANQVGCQPMRLYSGSRLMGDNPKYSLVCNNCLTVTPANRKRKRKPACSNCCNKHNNGEFSEKYLLTVVKNR